MSTPCCRSWCAASLTTLAALIVTLSLPNAVGAYGPDCCGTGGSCYSINGTPCCSDVACCQEVCSTLDPYCCAVEWDGFCAGDADALCNCAPADAPSNDTCAGAIPIGLGVSNISNVCANAGPPAHATCNDTQYLNLGLDVWYKYTASFTGPLEVSTCNQLDQSWDSQLAIYQGCNCGSLSDPPYGCSDADVDGCDYGTSLVTVNVATGTCYLIRVGSSYFGPGGTGTMTLTGSALCTVDTSGTTPEGETCGQSTNGGCENLPATPTFTSASCNAVLRGTAWNDNVNSDSDWYQFDTFQETEVTITLKPEFPAHFGFAQTNPPGSQSCANWNNTVTPSQTANGGCQLSSLTTTLSPGNWWVRVVPTGLDDLPCGGTMLGNDYVLTISCAADCPADLAPQPPDGFVNASDLAILLGAWGPDPAPPHPANINGDGFVNASDLALLLGAWGPCIGTAGACCNADGMGGCLQLTQEACASAGGLYLGDGTDCAECPPSPCLTSTEDCCAFHNSPGCELVDCCDAVCTASPFCCDNIWDTSCANLAAELCEECADPPANDTCTNSITLSEGNHSFSTIGATTDGAALAQCYSSADHQTHKDIWFDHSAACGGFLKVSTCDQATYDTTLVVYSGCNCNTMSFLGCNDDETGCNLATSELIVDVNMSQCYKVRVGGFQADDSGTGTLTLDCLCQNNSQCPPGKICVNQQCVNP